MLERANEERPKEASVLTPCLGFPKKVPILFHDSQISSCTYLVFFYFDFIIIWHHLCPSNVIYLKR